MPEPFAEPLRDPELEDRLRRLETAVAERLPDDETLADRLIARLSARAAERERNPDSAPMLVLAATGEAPPPPPQGAVLHPPSPRVAVTSTTR